MTGKSFHGLRISRTSYYCNKDKRCKQARRIQKLLKIRRTEAAVGCLRKWGRGHRRVSEEGWRGRSRVFEDGAEGPGGLPSGVGGIIV